MVNPISRFTLSSLISVPPLFDFNFSPTTPNTLSSSQGNKEGPRGFPFLSESIFRLNPFWRFSGLPDSPGKLKNPFAPAPGRVREGFAVSSSQRVRQAEEILRANGQWPPLVGECFVIQIDQDSPPPPPPRPPEDQRGTYLHPSEAELAWRKSYEQVTRYLQSYSGQTAVFRAVLKEKKIHLVEMSVSGPYRSSSHPGQRLAFSFTDFDGDGICDIASLRSGVYPFHGRSTLGVFPPWDDRRMKVGRDLNQDGVVDLQESEETSEAYATDVLWHAASDWAPVSVGCQTMPPGDFEKFRETLEGANLDTFTYILVRRPNERSGEYIW